MAFSADGKYMATGSDDKTVNLIDIQSKKIYHKFDDIHSSNNIYDIIWKQTTFINKIILIYNYIYI